MHREPVKSGNIVSVGHDPATNTMQVEFKTGGTFDYSNVSADKHRSMMRSDSVGKFFHNEFRSSPGHRCTKCPK